jgi:predicted nuclease with RNAse H fold
VSQLRDAFVGIDVAFAKTKRLPISVCTRADGDRLNILPLRKTFKKPPAGEGNAKALDPEKRKSFAIEVLNWMKSVEEDKKLRIVRIAIDAPSSYCRTELRRRDAETSLDRDGISCFATPSEAQFKEKIEEARLHLQSTPKEESRLPNANQIWMLIGFELFQKLGEKYKCIETYPQAIVRKLDCGNTHKSKPDGYNDQLAAVARILKATTSGDENILSDMGYGARHDKIDAFLSAWVGSLNEKDRFPYGTPPDDVIWVPNKQVCEKLAKCFPS